jgi:hypothetical protein
MSEAEARRAREEEVAARERIAATSEGAAAGLRSQVETVAERTQNPDFLGEASDPDVDPGPETGATEAHAKAWLSKQHMLSNRSPVFERKSELLDANRADREVRRHSPGRVLRQHPDVLATALGLDWTPEHGIEVPEGEPPVVFDTADKERVRDLADVATARKAMGVGATFLNNLMNAVTEHRQERRDETEATGVKAKVAEVFR